MTAAGNVKGNRASHPSCVINYVYYKEKSACLKAARWGSFEPILETRLPSVPHFKQSIPTIVSMWVKVQPDGCLRRLCQSELPHPDQICVCVCVRVWKRGYGGGFNSCREEKPCFIEKEIREASCKIAGNAWSISEEEPYFLSNLRLCDVSRWACAGDPELMSTAGSVQMTADCHRCGSLVLYFSYKSVAAVKMKPVLQKIKYHSSNQSSRSKDM